MNTRRPNRLAEPGQLGTPQVIVLAAAAYVVCGIGLLVLAMAVGTTKASNTLGQNSGFGISWPVLIIGMLALTAAVIGGLVLWLKPRKGSTRVDTLARYMATPRDMVSLSEQAQSGDAERLGVRDVGPGVPIGDMVNGGTPLLSSFEFVRIAILGPRAGKTSSVAIREVMETTGPGIVTSNKRDIVDATRGPRSERGVVRVHDVQALVNEPANWWWNPLSFIDSVEAAERMAGIFAASGTARDARSDAYFSAAAKEYLSGLLLAAAVGDQPISVLLRWMSQPDAGGPVELLAEHGYIQASKTLQATIDLTDKQRDGIIGTAAPWVSFLRNPRYLPWIEKTGPDDGRPHLDVHAFVASHSDTLYLISKEGEGSARAITAALTMATLDAADKLGAASSGMRVPRPVTATLDEAANVVRWPELPDLYSHYGSRGIILSVFLQSWTQGVEAWGEGGMKKMWSAANVRMVGAGVAETPFLRELSELVGTRDRRTGSVSTGRGGRSTSTSQTRDSIMDVADIAAMPPGRALVFSSGNPATLVKLIPWWTRDYASKVSASKDYYEKAGVTS